MADQSYPLLWEDIRKVRDRLADLLGDPLPSLPNLETAIRKVAQRNTELTGLLARWAELEAKATRLESTSDREPKS